jgi:hypothetical protein
MATWVWILIALAVVVVLALVAWTAYRSSQRRRLRERFGPEYDRAVADAPTRGEAEELLRTRERRREALDVRDLSPAARERFAEQWRTAQARFVDDPAAATGEADRLVQEVMRERGYPMDDFEGRAADISVDHPQLVDHYREGHEISVACARGDATTDDLRAAMVHYRILFEELLGERAVAER